VTPAAHPNRIRPRLSVPRAKAALRRILMRLKFQNGRNGKKRREFLRLIVLGGGAAVLARSARPEAALASGQADVLLLSCMDYRLIDATSRYMTERGLRNRYDHMVLAGASLGAITEKYPDWNKTFWDHLALAIDLHKIHEVIVLDHRDCGAYKTIFGEDFSQVPKAETEVHAAQLKRLKELIKGRYVELKVELLLMNLAGKVERI
jgi:hypothetical protein